MAYRFKAQMETIRRELSNTYAKMGAKNKTVRIDEDTGKVTLAFTRGGKEYQFSCTTWEDVKDNYRAAQLAICLMFRVFEEYGVGKFEQVFAGYRAIGSQRLLLENTSDPYDVLGVARDATADEVKARFRELAKEHHPDKGGDEGQFVKIKKAREEILAEI